MVAECIPCQLRNQTMILVQIVMVMRQNQIRGKIILELLELLLDFTARVRQKAVAKIVYGDFTLSGSKKRVRTFEGFVLSLLG